MFNRDAAVAEWQTRSTQNRLVVTSWEFESPPRHKVMDVKNYFLMVKISVGILILLSIGGFVFINSQKNHTGIAPVVTPQINTSNSSTSTTETNPAVISDIKNTGVQNTEEQSPASQYPIIDRNLFSVGFDQAIPGFYSTANPDFENVVRELGSIGATLRMPDGANSNLWHWQGNASGELLSELNAIGTTNLSKAQTTATNRTKNAKYRYYDRLVAMMQALGTNTSQVFLSLNVVSQSSTGILMPEPTDPASLKLMIDENMALLADIQSKGIHVSGVQLGAELTLTSFHPVFPNAETFIARAKPMALAIRAKYPNIPIVIHVAGYTKHKTPTVEDTFRNNWNAALLASNNNGHWFDDILFYMSVDNYEQVEQECTTTDVALQFDCFKAHAHDFTNNFSSIAGNYNTLFPGYKMWVGQWNLDNNGSTATGFNLPQVGNTVAQGLYIADYMSAAILYNGAHQNQFQNLSFMSLAGDPKNPITKYNNTTDDVGSVQVVGENIVKRVSFYVLKYFSEILNGNQEVLAATVAPVTGISPEDLHVLATIDQNTKSKDYIISNWSGKAIPLDKLVINGSPIAFTGAQAESIDGDHLWSTIGWKLHTGPFSNVRITKLHTVTDSSTMTIAPYSVTHIVLQ